MIDIEKLQSRPLCYMAHAVRPLKGSNETYEANIASAKDWLRSLTIRHPELCFIAPWISGVELFNDADEARRAAGLEHCHCVIARCDQFWSVGPRLSAGMYGEMLVAQACGLETISQVTGAMITL